MTILQFAQFVFDLSVVLAGLFGFGVGILWWWFVLFDAS